MIFSFWLYSLFGRVVKNASNNFETVLISKGTSSPYV